MTKSNPQNPILTKPVFISAHLDTTQVVGREIVASVKWNNRTYEISIRVRQDGNDSNLVTLANGALAKRVEALAAGMFGYFPPVDGQKISSHRDGSITVNNEEQDNNNPETRDAAKAAQTFKKAIAKNLDSRSSTEAFSLDEEAIHTFKHTYEAKPNRNSTPVDSPDALDISSSSNPLYNATQAAAGLNPIYDENDAMAGRAVIKPLLDRPRYSASDNTFKIFASPQDRKAYFEEATRAVLQARKASKGETKKTLDGLRLSQIHRQDYRLSIEAISSDLQAIVDQEKLTSHHRLFYTSPYNHSGYVTSKGKFFYTEHAVPSSSDRVSSMPTMGRAILDENGTSISYTGQPTTEAMALVAIRNMIKTEYAATQSRTAKSKLKQTEGSEVFELPFLVNGLLTTSIFHGLRGLDYETPMVEGEKKALEALYGQTIPVEVEPGKTIQVKVKPFFVNTSLNDCVHPIQAWSDGLSGLANTRKLSQTGNNRFQAYARTEIARLKQGNDSDKTKALQLEQALAALNITDPDASLDSINKLIDRAFICELLEIPFYTHCKSSIDRTSFSTGIASVVHQMIQSGNIDLFQTDVADNTKEKTFTPHSIMQSSHADAFKDLVVLNASVGSVFVEMSRGKPGFQWSAIIPEHFRTARNSDLIDSLRKKSGLGKKLLQRLIRRKFKALRAQHAAYMANLREHAIEPINTDPEPAPIQAPVNSDKIIAATKIQALVRGHLARQAVTRASAEAQRIAEEDLGFDLEPANIRPIIIEEEDDDASHVDPDQVEVMFETASTPSLEPEAIPDEVASTHQETVQERPHNANQQDCMRSLLQSMGGLGRHHVPVNKTRYMQDRITTQIREAGRQEDPE